MINLKRCARINVKLLVILMIVMVALGTSLFAAREVRRGILSKRSLEAGQAAFEKEDWPAACSNFREYLGRNPEDVEILKKYGKARLSMRPLDAAAIGGAIAAYRSVIQLDPLDEDAYEQLATLYTGIRNFEELAYVARRRLEHVKTDRNAPLWLAQSLIQLNRMEEARQALDEFIKELEALPDKHPEYVSACTLMSQVILADNSTDARTKAVKALEQLNRAVEYAPDSVEVLVSRARFYRAIPDIPDATAEDRAARARKDLEAADALGTKDPSILYSLGAEWIQHGEIDRAAAELHAAESLPQEALEEHFLDVNDWTVAKFLLASELEMRRGAVAEGVSLVDEALTVLKETRHRLQVLPPAIELYVAAGKVSEARPCLDEYLETVYAREGPVASKLRLAWLQALVANAEQKPYAVINALQPVDASGASGPEMLRLWRLLAAAYNRTGQTRRAVRALVKYLGYQPRDAEMTLQLAREYSKLGDWNKALEAARLAESLKPTDVTAKLLRIGASINLAVKPGESADAGKLEELSAQLAQLSQEHPDLSGIRGLQASIAPYLEQPKTAETELKLAIEESEEPLGAEMQLVGHYYRAKRMAEAIDVCQTACERHAEVAQPWLCLSELHMANKDYEKAQNCLKQGLSNVVDEPQKQSLSIRLALLELMQGDRTAGIRRLSKLADEDQQEIRARLLLLGIREIREDGARAEKLVGELKQIEGPSGLWWRLHEASLWLSSDEWRSKQPDITDRLQDCIDSDPQWSAPVLLLAEMYEKLQDLRRVEDTCRQAIDRNPSATAVADKLITLLEKQGRFPEAEKVLQQIEADPRIASAWQVRMAIGTGDFSRAIDELKLRVSNDDQDASSRIQLAQLIYQETGDAAQAFEYLNEAEAIDPNSRTLTAVRVSILRAEGQTEQARRILDNYVADHNDFNAYWMRAVYLTEEGEFEHAEQDYKKLTTFTEGGPAGYELLSNFYGSNDELDKAVMALEEGLNAFPEDLRLKRRLMKTLFARAQAQDRQRATEILATLEERLPQDPELMKLRALQMLAEPTPQSLETARQKLENVVKLEPTAVDAHLLLIRILMQEGEYETARDSAIGALGSNEDNLALLSARGRAELALQNAQMAAKLAHLVLQKDPNSTEALDVLVAAAMNTNDRSLLEQSLTLIESAIGRNPGNERLLVSRAHVMVALGRPQMAIPELQTYCQTKEGSGSIIAIVTLADLYRLKGDIDQAEQWIEQAESLDPKNQSVIHTRFLWLASQNRFDEIAEISSAYLSANEQNPMTLVAAASILAASDSMELKKEGLKLFEHAVTLAPTLLNARLGLASTHYQTGNAEGAEKIYRQLLEQNPNQIQALNDLAWILQEQYHRYPEALELANRGLGILPNDLHLLDTRGTILSNMADRLADARNDFEKLARLSPADTPRQAKALLQLGRVCAELNDLAQAKQHLENALEIDRKIDIFTPDERSEITKILQRSGMQAASK